MYSVVGCGVVGLCTATALSEAGHEVELVLSDSASAPVSLMAGGMLAPYCEGESAPADIVSAGQGAADWWAARVPDVVRCGTLVLAAQRDGHELERFARMTQAHVWVEPSTLEPDLEQRFARGLFFRTEAHLNPQTALAALRVGLDRRGVCVSATARGRVIDCRGWAAQSDLPQLRAVRGEMITVFAPEVTLMRTVRLLHPRFPCYIVPRGAGHYMIGATMVESDRAGPITARAAMELLSAAYTVHPGFAEAEITQMAAGLRPAFPDNRPRVERRGTSIYINGMYRHGFLIAPYLAQQVAALISEDLVNAT